MKFFFYIPLLIEEWIKANLVHPSLYYTPSTESIRNIEQDARNDARLAAYYTKKYFLDVHDD